MGSDPGFALCFAVLDLFQSTLPCGERQLQSLPTRPETRVSIHTPVRGATGAMRDAGISLLVSIHRSRAGSDKIYPGRFACYFCFNPRSRAGSDCRGPRSATIHGSFNPRSRAGSDLSHSCQSSHMLWGFNPRSRAGSDTRR